MYARPTTPKTSIASRPITKLRFQRVVEWEVAKIMALYLGFYLLNSITQHHPKKLQYIDAASQINFPSLIASLNILFKTLITPSFIETHFLKAIKLNQFPWANFKYIPLRRYGTLQTGQLEPDFIDFTIHELNVNKIQ